ncbi:MAG: T9SS type A sorting domain-containing protein [Bacteroidota bacterium]
MKSHLNTFCSYPYKSWVLGLFFLPLLMLNTTEAQACVDPGPDTLARIVVRYDSMFDQLEVRFTNLRLMTENPGKLCTCGLSSFSNAFTNILYVAFVDSGTNNPYPGFNPWDANQNATTAWNNQAPPYSWDSFVGAVNSGGLQVNAPVELVIRAGLPAGYDVIQLDSASFSLVLGTDEYSAAGDSLAGAHRGIREAWNMSRTLIETSSSYFATVDSAIEAYFLANSIENPSPIALLEVYPNPIEDQLRLKLELKSLELIEVSILDLHGRTVATLQAPKQLQGILEQEYDLGANKLPSGIYLLRIRAEAWVQSEKILIQ